MTKILTVCYSYRWLSCKIFVIFNSSLIPIMKRILFVLICLVLSSCNYFDVKKTSSEEILKEELQTFNWKDVDETRIESHPYRAKTYNVKGISVRWLSKYGEDDVGRPEYGLRMFTAQPGGEIPIHNHFYVQTMYILTGNISVTTYDFETDEKVAEEQAGPNDVIFIPSMEPHSLSNMSDQEEVTFLCCIANVYEEDA